jgi:hypothetical protein
MDSLRKNKKIYFGVGGGVIALFAVLGIVLLVGVIVYANSKSANKKFLGIFEIGSKPTGAQTTVGLVGSGETATGTNGTVTGTARPPSTGFTCQSEVGANCSQAPCCPGLNCIGGVCLQCVGGAASPRRPSYGPRNPNKIVSPTCNACAGMTLPKELGGSPDDVALCNQCGACEGQFYNIQ